MHQKKKLKIPLIIMIVICITVIGGIGVFAATDTGAKLELINAIVKTKGEFESKERLSYENIFIDENYIQNLYDGAIHAKGNVKFKSISQNGAELEDYDILKGAGFDFDVSYDVPNKKLLSKSSVKFLGFNLIDYNFYTDNEKLMFNVPQAYDKWISMGAKNIQEQYNNSVFAQDGKLPEDEEISFQLFSEDGLKYMANYKLAYQIKDKFKNINIEKLLEDYQDISVEELEENKTIDTDNGSIQCKGFSVNIPKSVMNEIANNVIDSFKNDEVLNDIIIQYIKNQYNSNCVLQDYYELLDDFTSVIECISLQDLNGKFYINSEGIIVDFNLKTTIYNNEDMYIAVISGGFEGTDNLTDKQTLGIALMSHEQETNSAVVIQFTNDEAKSGDDIKNLFDLSFIARGENINTISLELLTESNFNKKNGKTNFAIDIIDYQNDHKVGLLFDGYITTEEKNKSINVDFDDVSIAVNSKDLGENEISFLYKNKIEPLTNEIEEPSEEKVEIFKCSEEEIEDIIQSVLNRTSLLYKTLTKSIINQ